MQLKLLVVLEAGAAALRVGEYLARVCAGATGERFGIVLYGHRPALPTWLESAESRNVAVLLWKYEKETREQAAECLAGVRRTLVEHGVSDDLISEEIAETSNQAVQDILASAGRHACDTIVIARHHKSILREFFEGDFEEKLLRRPIGVTLWLVD